MCYKIRLIYRCVVDSTLTEDRCLGHHGKTTVRSSQSRDDYSAPPIIEYCSDGKKAAEEGRRCPWTQDSPRRQDELLCPVKCPACWSAFINRLHLSPQETQAVQRALRGDRNDDDCTFAVPARLCDNGHEGSMAAGSLAADNSKIVAVFNDAVVSECIRAEVRVEARFDALVLRIAEELVNGGDWDSPRVSEHLAELSSMEVKYKSYEAIKKMFLDGYPA